MSTADLVWLVCAIVFCLIAGITIGRRSRYDSQRLHEGGNAIVLIIRPGRGEHLVIEMYATADVVRPAAFLYAVAGELAATGIKPGRISEVIVQECDD